MCQNPESTQETSKPYYNFFLVKLFLFSFHDFFQQELFKILHIYQTWTYRWEWLVKTMNQPPSISEMSCHILLKIDHNHVDSYFEEIEKSDDINVILKQSLLWWRLRCLEQPCAALCNRSTSKESIVVSLNISILFVSKMTWKIQKGCTESLKDFQPVNYNLRSRALDIFYFP